MVESAWKAEFIGMVVMIAATFSPGKWWGAADDGRYVRTNGIQLDAAATHAITTDVAIASAVIAGTIAVAIATAAATSITNRHDRRIAVITALLSTPRCHRFPRA